MAEWPKTGEDVWYDIEFACTDYEALMDRDLIPADLGRELYEAAREYAAARGREVVPRLNRLNQALARYEREVGGV